MTWREIKHEDGHVLVEYANGSRLNIRYNHLIEAQDPDRASATVLPSVSGTPAAQIASTRYTFREGDILPPHRHDDATLHDILVVKGSLFVRKETGNIAVGEGDRVDLKVNELHSLEALTDAVTLHTLVAPWKTSSS